MLCNRTQKVTSIFQRLICNEDISTNVIRLEEDSNFGIATLVSKNHNLLYKFCQNLKGKMISDYIEIREVCEMVNQVELYACTLLFAYSETAVEGYKIPNSPQYCENENGGDINYPEVEVYEDEDEESGGYVEYEGVDRRRVPDRRRRGRGGVRSNDTQLGGRTSGFGKEQTNNGKVALFIIVCVCILIYFLK